MLFFSNHLLFKLYILKFLSSRQLLTISKYIKNRLKYSIRSASRRSGTDFVFTERLAHIRYILTKRCAYSNRLMFCYIATVFFVWYEQGVYKHRLQIKFTNFIFFKIFFETKYLQVPCFEVF